MTFSGIKLWSHYILKYNHKIICREGHAYNFEHETVTEKKMAATKSALMFCKRFPVQARIN